MTRLSLHNPPRRGRFAWLLVPLLALALVPAPPQDPDRTAPWPRHGSYIGAEQCADCHDGEEEAILSGVHRPVVHSELTQSCETCHGPGKKHANDEDNDTTLITYPPKLSFENQKQLCGRCHQREIDRHGGDLEGFAVAKKLCTDCHQIHAAKKPKPYPELTFSTKLASLEHATPVGAQKCVSCHPLRSALLAENGHAELAHSNPEGCETCHGNGSKHVETGGIARLITRPDRASDGMATCRSCHSKVDPVEFHWKGRHKPLLSAGMTCTTCHRIHSGPRQPAPAKRPVFVGLKTSASPHASDLPRENPPRPLRRSGQPPEFLPGMRRPPAVTQASQQTPGRTPTNRVCTTCHEPAFGILPHTIHESLGDKDVALDQGCGACHAGALEHARQGGRKQFVQSMRGTDAATQARTCAQCHGQDPAMRHSRHGSHYKSEVTCLTCHSPAASRGKVREDASKACATCHAQVAAELRMPNHHPVHLRDGDGGTMACVDCHDPHSARPRIRDRKLRQDNCVKCHTQYRGPFVFAHQASRADGCVVCHTPHGSTNRRLLRQHTSQQNCLQCHGDFPSFHDQTSGAVFTNCLNCHTEIHGSNHSRYLFR